MNAELKVISAATKSGGSCLSGIPVSKLSTFQKKFQEYVAAKSIGEKICEKLSVTTNLTVFFPRLGKISTDQTLSFIQENNLDAVDVAIDIAKLLSCKLEN